MGHTCQIVITWIDTKIGQYIYFTKKAWKILITLKTYQAGSARLLDHKIDNIFLLLLKYC